MTTGLVFDTSDLSSGLSRISERLAIALMMHGTTKATELETFMKVNRCWRDRTSLAKNSLSAKCSPTPEGIRITLAHGVDYGLWLELGREKRYAIVEPTLRLKGPEMLQHFTNLMEELNRR